jgi:hypothetical protein
LALLLAVFIGRADAATEWVKLYRSDLPDPEWLKIITSEGKGQVVAIYDNSFTIDIGMDEGARAGGMYLVYSERVPHRGKEPIAVVMVSQTAEKFSVCNMTRHVNGGLVRVGDWVVPVAVSSRHEAVSPVPVIPSVITVTEGYISQNGPHDYAVPAVYAEPGAAAAPMVQPVASAGYAQPAAYAEPVQYNFQPPAAYPQAQYNYPPQTAPQPQYNYPQQGAPQPQYNYPPQAAPQYAPQPAVQAPVPPQSPFPGSATYPPFPNYPQAGQVRLDFDANRIADARLIRTFPLSQPDMNALEIQFRGSYDMFAAGKYYEAFEGFMRQSSYQGNYLSPYWAGMCALRLGDRQTAVSLFNNSLGINPYYEPARHGLLTADGTIRETPAPAPNPVRRAAPKRK